MTVNHDVTGSSPVGGATAKAEPVFASDNVGRKKSRYKFIWTNSSVGQSNRLITGWSGVRVPVGPETPLVLFRGALLFCYVW